MRVIPKKVSIGLAVLVAIAMFSTPQAFAAKASFDSPPGEPPYGLAVHGNAGGTKLYGTVEIEIINPRATAEVRAVARLRKGNDVRTFYAYVGSNVEYLDDVVLQNAVTDALSIEVLDYFFKDQSGLCIWLKAVSELGQSRSYYEGLTTMRFRMMDIEVAVNACR